MSRFFSLLGGYFPWLVIGGAYALAVAVVSLQRAKSEPEDTIVIRLGHWQLEAGVREAIDVMAADYQKLHPNVKVVAQAIPESTYKQWLSTQIIGGTAPDVVQVGKGMIPANLMLAFFTRYLLPVTPYVNQPNPYNAGTELEGVPLRLTYKDAMRWAYVEELQEYMSISLSQFSVRLFYNKDLLQKLTGRTEAPQDYREFLAVCEQIGAQTMPNGKSYTPSASSQYHFNLWQSRLLDPVTFPAVWRADFNRDATLGKDEFYVAFMKGLIDFKFPPYEARFQMVRDVTPHFQAGFTGLTRDEAVFLFAQQQAVFIPVGTWDARSLIQQAAGKFEVGIADFPIPTEEDPVYGHLIAGPFYEEAGSGFGFAVARTSHHPDVAIDFLRFMASRRQNEKLNKIIGWIPAIAGAQIDPLFEDFQPRLEGIYRGFDVSLGGDTIIKWEQLYSLYQVNQISFEDMVAQFEEFLRTRGMEDYLELKRNERRKLVRDEQLVTGIRGRALVGEGDAAELQWLKYRATGGRLLRPELGPNRQMKMLTDPESVKFAPYEYLPEALKKIEQRLASELAAPP